MPYADPVIARAYKAKKAKEYNARNKAKRLEQRKASGKTPKTKKSQPKINKNGPPNHQNLKILWENKAKSMEGY